MFSINEDGLLIIDKVEAREIQEIKAIIVRDKTSRSKPVAFMELLYIYMVHNPKSLFADLNEKDRREKVKVFIKAPKDWNPDDKVKEAEDAYVESLELSSTYKAYVSASRGIYAIGNDIDFFNEQKHKIKIELLNVSAEIEKTRDKEHRVELSSREDYLANKLMVYTKNIQTLTESLNNNYDTLENLKKRVAEEQQQRNEVRGGGTVHRREE